MQLPTQQASTFDPVTIDTVLMVAKISVPNEVANSLFHAICDNAVYPPMRAIGAGAVNQAVKASIIATGWCAARGISVVWRTGFEDVTGNDKRTVTAVTMRPVRIS